MSYQNKPGSGAIFKNDKKEKNIHPDYRGTINIEGRDFDIALWLKDGKKGKFFSAAVKEKDFKKPGTNDIKDDIPF